MKTLKEIFESNDGFPALSDFRKKDGNFYLSWNCGKELATEYMNAAEYALHEKDAWNKSDFADSIQICIITTHPSPAEKSYWCLIGFNTGEKTFRNMKFSDNFKTPKDAKTKMYNVLCKIKDDKDICRKMSNTLSKFNRDISLKYDEFMAL
jgi:hypothetical protein